MKWNKSILAFLIFQVIGLMFLQSTTAQILKVEVFPDSVINDVSNHPVGINLNFFMDGGRFPDAKHSTKDALKKMGVKYLRYPGGEKSDLYLFSLPPYDQSKPALARTVGFADYPEVIKDGKSLIYDPLDFDEFMSVCRSNNSEPVIVVAADNYLLNVKEGEKLSTREELISHACEWVRYANIKKNYGIKYWMIGNESWNSNNENSTVDIYAQDVIDFSKAMKAVDPSILIIPNGDSEDFFKTVITKAGNYIDRLCVSNYGVYNFFRGYDTYRDTTQVLIGSALTAINAMNKFSSKSQLEKYKIIVSEFGSIDWANYWKGTNDIGHAIVTFDMAGQLLLQPQIEFSCLWNTRWIENESKPGTDHDALDKDGNLNPTGIALMIWGNFLGKKMIKTQSTAPIITYGSIAKDKVYLYLINKSEKTQKIIIDFGNYKIKAVGQAWEYFGKTPGDMKPILKQKKNVSIEGCTLSGLSISVIELLTN